MTTACLVFLSISLVMYLVATLLYQGHFLLARSGWDGIARKMLVAGVGINAVGLGLHFVLSGTSPFSNMLLIIAILVMALVAASLILERNTPLQQLSMFIAPLAFLGLLYPVLMPVRFDDAESILLRFPWLGVHVAVTLLGHVGFTIAFCAAVVHIIQARLLKSGRLNRFLPALDTAATAAYYATGAGFLLFTVGLAMGLVWLFGAPGEYLGPRDTKIWLSIPTWGIFVVYLYSRGVRRQYGSRLMWFVIVGFLLAVINLVGVRHGFEEAIEPPASPSPAPVSSCPGPGFSSPMPGSASSPSASVHRQPFS